MRLGKIGDAAIFTKRAKTKIDDKVKTKIAYKKRIADVQETEKIIESLRFWLNVLHRKQRRIYHFGKIEVVLDEMRFRIYMEIEGVRIFRFIYGKIGRILQISDS